MALNSTVLFGLPQSEIASLLNQKISKAQRIRIVTGFVTVEGIKALENSLRINPANLEVLVIGAGTYKAYEAMDELIGFGIPNDNLFIHLGHSRLTKSGAAHAFYRYHPMLHSKIYYFENNNGTACAFVGSHNITGFALMGLNGEASIMLEGEIKDPEFEKIRNHIDLAKNEAIIYRRGMKEAYSWWTYQFMNGLAYKTNDIPKDFEKKKTILIFCKSEKVYPVKNEILYFELPQGIDRIQSLGAEVHVFIFNVLPANPFECLAKLAEANKNFWCSIEGIENDEGGKELSADWFIQSGFPNLQRASNPFRPTPTIGMQQIRVRLVNQIFDKYDYLFGKQDDKWLPVLNKEKKIHYDISFSSEIEKLSLIPPETGEWLLVNNLIRGSEGVQEKDSIFYTALKALEPESGSFILFSTRRKKIN